MSSATASTMPEDEVETLMQQVADAHSLDFKASAVAAGTAPIAQAAGSSANEDALEQRLAALRG